MPNTRLLWEATHRITEAWNYGWNKQARIHTRDYCTVEALEAIVQDADYAVAYLLAVAVEVCATG